MFSLARLTLRRLFWQSCRGGAERKVPPISENLDLARAQKAPDGLTGLPGLARPKDDKGGRGHSE